MIPVLVLALVGIAIISFGNVEGYDIGEDPDYLIMDGQHPQISYVEARRSLSTNKDLRMKYLARKSNSIF